MRFWEKELKERKAGNPTPFACLAEEYEDNQKRLSALLYDKTPEQMYEILKMASMTATIVPVLNLICDLALHSLSRFTIDIVNQEVQRDKTNPVVPANGAGECRPTASSAG